MSFGKFVNKFLSCRNRIMYTKTTMTNAISLFHLIQFYSTLKRFVFFFFNFRFVNNQKHKTISRNASAVFGVKRVRFCTKGAAGQTHIIHYKRYFTSARANECAADSTYILRVTICKMYVVFVFGLTNWSAHHSCNTIPSAAIRMTRSQPDESLEYD